LRSRAFYTLVGVIALAAVISSCSRPAREPDPQAVLAAYLDALISSNTEEAGKYLSAQATAQAPSQADKSRENESFEAKMVRRAFASYISYEIAIVERADARARATVKIKAPDFQRIARDIAVRLTEAKFPEGGIESLDYTTEIVNKQVRVYKEQGIPLISILRNYGLVKEGGSWKISEWD